MMIGYWISPSICITFIPDSGKRIYFEKVLICYSTRFVFMTNDKTSHRSRAGLRVHGLKVQVELLWSGAHLSRAALDQEWKALVKQCKSSENRAILGEGDLRPAELTEVIRAVTKRRWDGKSKTSEAHNLKFLWVTEGKESLFSSFNECTMIRGTWVSGFLEHRELPLAQDRKKILGFTQIISQTP